MTARPDFSNTGYQQQPQMSIRGDFPATKFD